MKILIIGAGEVGYNIASRLAFENKDVIVIDKKEDALKRFSENIDVKVIVGSGSDPMILKRAGVDESEMLVAVTDSDEINLVACLMGDILAPGIKKLARIRSDSYVSYYSELQNNVPYIDTVINPDIEVIRIIENFMNFPNAVDIVDFAGGSLKFVGVKINRVSLFVGVELKKLPTIIKKNIPLIVAIVRDEELIIPKGKDILYEGDLVYFVTEDEKLLETMEVFNPDAYGETVKRVLIVGGSVVGYYLAKRLERSSVSCKIIDKKATKCEYLARKLNNTVVLHGDGSDQGLLIEENIHKIDVVITLTNDDETNILVSLLAKRMGAKKTITQVSKISYASIMSTIGIEQVVSSRLSAVNTILRHIRKGKILSTVTIKCEAGEVMEAVAMPTSDLVLKPLKKISFPKKAMVAAIVRQGSIIIPNGNSIIKPGDRFIVFAKKEAISAVEKTLSIKLECI